MKSYHLLRAKKRRTSRQFDLQNLFDDYWISATDELTVQGTSFGSQPVRMSDGEAQRSWSLRSTVAPWYSNSLQTLPFVSCNSPPQPADDTCIDGIFTLVAP
jgi:hypothetical protein